MIINSSQPNDPHHHHLPPDDVKNVSDLLNLSTNHTTTRTTTKSHVATISLPTEEIVELWFIGLYALGIGIGIGTWMAHAMNLPMLVDREPFPFHPNASRAFIPDVAGSLILVTIWYFFVGWPCMEHWPRIVLLLIVSPLWMSWLLYTRYDAFTKRQNTKYLLLLMIVLVLPLTTNMLLIHYVFSHSGAAGVMTSRTWRLLLQIPLVLLIGRMLYLAFGRVSMRSYKDQWFYGHYLQGGRDRIHSEHVALLVSGSLTVIHLLLILAYIFLDSLITVMVVHESTLHVHHHHHHHLVTRTHHVHLHILAGLAIIITLNIWLVSQQRYDEGQGWMGLIKRFDSFRYAPDSDWNHLRAYIPFQNTTTLYQQREEPSAPTEVIVVHATTTPMRFPDYAPPTSILT